MKKYFSFSLYKDALCQLKIPVIAFLIISLCYQLLFFAENAVLQLTMTTFYGANSTMAFSFYLLTPIMTFVLFRFMCKRNSSDFYHSIPFTRVSIVISFSVAIMTMVAVFLIINAICTTIIYTFVLDLYVISYKISMLEMLNLFFNSFLVMSIIIIAFSLGGTVFNNLIIGGVILIGPMALIENMSDKIRQTAISAANDYIFGIFNMNNHTLATMIFSYDDNLFNNTTRILTSLALGIICYIVAIIFFNKRRSESAASFTFIKTVRLFLNICLTFVTCIYPADLIYHKIIKVGEEQYHSVFDIVKWYLVALMVCILFEFVMTRTLKNLKVFIPVLISVILLNATYIGGLLLEYNKYMNFTPKADEIEYIRVIDDYYSYDSNFLEYITSEIKYDDPALKEMVASRLQYYSHNPGASFSGGKGTVYPTLAICVNGKEYYRDVYFDGEEDGSKFLELTYYSQKNVAKYRLFPSYNDCVIDTYRLAIKLNDKDKKNLYNTLIEELKSLSDEQLIDYAMDRTDLSGLSGFTIYDNKIATFDLKINSYVPKTLNYWFELNKATNDNNYAQISDAFKNNKVNSISINHSTSYAIFKAENMQTAFDMINAHKADTCSLGNQVYDCFVVVDIGNGETARYRYYFTSDSKEFLDYYNENLPKRPASEDFIVTE